MKSTLLDIFRKSYSLKNHGILKIIQERLLFLQSMEI